MVTTTPALFPTPNLPTTTATADDDGVDWLFGAGITYQLLDKLTVRAEWERYHGLSSNNNNIDLFSVGLSYHFDPFNF